MKYSHVRARRASRGFTLIELLVVIGIIGILAAVMMTQFSGSTEAARATHCMANLRNLSIAVQNTAMSGSYYPVAESHACLSHTGDENNQYWIPKGWISPLEPAGIRVNGGSFPSVSFTDSEEKMREAVTNGAIWAQSGRSLSSYVCPSHVKACRTRNGTDPGWSYRMNEAFGCDPKNQAGEAGHRAFGTPSCLKEGSTTQRKSVNADRCLLFAEIPAVDIDTFGVKAVLSASGTEGDMVLNYRKGEVIGFNHRLGNKGNVGHVAFADGHVSKLAVPKSGSAANLTAWLCQGDEIRFNGAVYERVE